MRPATLLAYEKRTSPLLRLFPHTEFEDFTHVELETLLSKTPALSRRTTITALNSLFRWADARDMVAKDPTRLLGELRQPKQTYTETFSEAEVEALTGMDGEDGLRMLLMFDTGLRIGELCALKVRDVQEQRGQLIVLQGKGGKDRVVPLTARLKEAFAYWSLVEGVQPDDYVFGHRKPGGHEGMLHRREPLSTDALRLWFYGALDRAGVRRLKPHTTRHTLATTLIRKGAPIAHVSKVLGHASIATTVDAYSHLVTEDLRGIMELLEA